MTDHVDNQSPDVDKSEGNAHFYRISAGTIEAALGCEDDAAPGSWDELLERAEAWQASDGPPARDLMNAVTLIADLAAALRSQIEETQENEKVFIIWRRRCMTAEEIEGDLRHRIEELEAELAEVRFNHTHVENVTPGVDGTPAWAYDEDGYCVCCGNGRWKYHMPECQLRDAFEVLTHCPHIVTDGTTSYCGLSVREVLWEGKALGNGPRHLKPSHILAVLDAPPGTRVAVVALDAPAEEGDSDG